MTEIGGVGESTSRTLEEQGLKRVADVANASVDQVAAAKGFGPVRAEQVIAAAAALLAAAADTAKPLPVKRGRKSGKVEKDSKKAKEKEGKKTKKQKKKEGNSDKKWKNNKNKKNKNKKKK